MPKIKGKLVDVSPRFWKNGWGYGTIEAGNRKIKVTGTLQDVPLGTDVLLTGVWEESKYGPSFNFKKLEAILADFSIQAWLRELPEVGPVRAAQIVSLFGDELEDILLEDPLRLTEIRGLTEERAEIIGETYLEEKDSYQFVQALVAGGLSVVQAKKLAKEFDDPDDIDPFDLYMSGRISFSEALDCTLPTTRRDEAGCYHSLKEVQAETGDTLFLVEDLVNSDIATPEQLLTWAGFNGSIRLVSTEFVALRNDWICANDIFGYLQDIQNGA